MIDVQPNEQMVNNVQEEKKKKMLVIVELI